MFLRILTVLCGPLRSGSAIFRNIIFKYMVMTVISLVSAQSIDSLVFNPLNFKPDVVHHLWPSASLAGLLLRYLPRNDNDASHVV